MNPIKVSEYHIKVIYEHSRPAELLANAAGLSITFMKQAMQKGAVWITDNKGTRRLRRQSKKPLSGSELHFYYNDSVLNEKVEDAILISDEKDYSVWFKPSGMLSQGSKWGDHTTITRFVENYFEFQRPVFLVHRLDKAASGLILVSHKKTTTKALATLFAERKIYKRYRVIVKGKFPQQAEIVISNQLDDREALSRVKLIEYSSLLNQTLLEVVIETGRKHQIRRHLAEFGYPVVGDRLYGVKDQMELKGSLPDLQLCSVYLAFKCPLTENEKVFELSADMQSKVSL